jgi:hypothetical protein
MHTRPLSWRVINPIIPLTLLMAAVLSMVSTAISVAEPQVRVRRAQGDEWLRGDLVELREDRVILRPDGTSRADTLSPRAGLTVEVCRGSSVSARRVFGGVILGTIVGIMGAVIVNHGSDHPGGLGLWGMGIGASAGFIVGIIPVEEWEELGPSQSLEHPGRGE